MDNNNKTNNNFSLSCKDKEIFKSALKNNLENLHWRLYLLMPIYPYKMYTIF